MIGQGSQQSHCWDGMQGIGFDWFEIPTYVQIFLYKLDMNWCNIGVNPLIPDNPEWFMSWSTNVCDKTVKSSYLQYAYFQLYEFILKFLIVFVKPLPCPFSFTTQSLNDVVAESNGSGWVYRPQNEQTVSNWACFHCWRHKWLVIDRNY